MKLRELYNMLGESSIPPDAELDLSALVDRGELVVAAPARVLPPPPSDEAPKQTWKQKKEEAKEAEEA